MLELDFKCNFFIQSITWNLLDSGSLTHDCRNIGDNVKTTDLIPAEDDDYE